MGHWFAYISRGKPCLLSDILINRAEPISKQHSEHYFPRLLPHRGKNKLDDSTNKLLKIHNSLLNMDGLGITWYTKASQDYGTGVSGNWPALYESQSSPINDIIFRSLCGHTETYCLLPTSAHQVAASSRRSTATPLCSAATSSCITSPSLTSRISGVTCTT